MSTNSIEHFVVSLLAVGGFSLERTWALLDRLREEGLVEPLTVAVLSEGEVVKRLAAAGYDRGECVTTSMAQRLVACHAAIRSGHLERVSSVLREGRVEKAKTLLCQLKGVGPVVFESFKVLEES